MCHSSTRTLSATPSFPSLVIPGYALMVFQILTGMALFDYGNGIGHGALVFFGYMFITECVLEDDARRNPDHPKMSGRP